MKSKSPKGKHNNIIDYWYNLKDMAPVMTTDVIKSLVTMYMTVWAIWTPIWPLFRYTLDQ